MTTETLTLEYKLKTFETLPSHKSDRKSKFAIYLYGELIGLVASPVHDGSRLLLSLGYPPETLLTTKSKDSQHASWKPQPLSHWAKSTVKERDSGGLAAEPFTQFPGVAPTAPSKPLPSSPYQKTTEGPVRYAPGIAEAVL